MPRKHFIPREFIEEKDRPAKQLAEKYRIGVSTVYKWCKAVEIGEKHKLKRQFEVDGRLLGILWSVGVDNGDHILLSYQHRYILEEANNKLGLNYKIWKAQSPTVVQYRIKLVGDVYRNLSRKLKELGWTNRWAEERFMPRGLEEEEYRKFVLTYIEMHSSLDSRKGRPRLRVYGNRVLMQEMNEMIPELFDVKKKTPQKVTDKTWALYYQKEEEIRQLIKYCKSWS